MVLIKETNLDRLESINVSVPLRGLWFLSHYLQKYFNDSFMIDVSVPLRGLWFLSKKVLTFTLKRSISFRPLAGIMVLIGNRPTDETSHI